MVKLQNKPRTLIFSLRNIFAKALFRFSLYEFENVISEIDSVELLAPKADIFNFRYGLAKRLGYHAPLVLSPNRDRIALKTDYDLFLTICGAPTDLLMLKMVSNWRDRCRTAVCLIDELWIKQLDEHRHFLDVLKHFDLVILYYSNTVGPLHERIGRKCAFVPPGVDAIRFCPYPEPPRRGVDVYSIGRRSEITHQRLLRMAEEEGLFYLYDTIAGDQARTQTEHRPLMANVAKRSRYFIVNPGQVNQPSMRGKQVEVGNRYFEGSAAGAILLGERPDNEVFSRLFDWPDALIHLPYDSTKVDEIIRELDMQPERQETIRRTNVTQALLRHDWVYRWESILETVKLEPLPGLLKRKERLKSISEAVPEHSLAVRHATAS